MKLRDLNAELTQVMPLADGIYTGLYYLCPGDPQRKRAHSIFFEPHIVPADYLASELYDERELLRYLNGNESWRRTWKWQRTGMTIDDLTLTPSISQTAYNLPGKPECCHINIINGIVSGKW